MSSLRLAAALALLGASLTSTASAYEAMESNWNPASLPVRYRINEASIPEELGVDTGRSAVDDAFATWAAASCTTFTATNAGTTALSLAEANDGENSIMWLSRSWPDELGDVDSVIGVTTPMWFSGRYFVDADIQFNNVGFTWSTTGSRGTVDAQSIALHEEGHFLGLDHSAFGAAVMYASYAGGRNRVLTSDDANGVCAIYPREGSSGGSMSGGDPGGSFGDSCARASDCTSDAVCVGSSAADAFCSTICNTDCECPNGYECVPATRSISVCAPGINQCAGRTGSGTTNPGSGTAQQDAGVPDADVSEDPGTDSEDGADASTEEPDAEAHQPVAQSRRGCSVGVATEGGTSTFAHLGAGLLAVVLAARRRRRL